MYIGSFNFKNISECRIKCKLKLYVWETIIDYFDYDLLQIENRTFELIFDLEHKKIKIKATPIVNAETNDFYGFKELKYEEI